MSTLQSKLRAKFEPTRDRSARPPGAAVLIFGVIYPAAVIAIEFASRLCADAFFDPLPTYGHVLAATFVPASNLLVWIRLQDPEQPSNNWWLFTSGAGIAIATCYALLFLPLLPMALVGIVFLIGLLPMAPLSSLICALKLCSALRDPNRERAFWGPLVGGLAAGLVFLIALDLPGTASRLAIEWAASDVPAERERGLAWLRRLGDEELLLRLSYGNAGRPTLMASALVLVGNNLWLGQPRRQLVVSPAQAREIYYRVYGTPFNARPAPIARGRWTPAADFQFDEDHGGTQVGGRLKGLTMQSSRIDGSIAGDDAVAYLEWTVEFRNSGPIDREVRLQFALPPGAVVSRATLWVDGEEREAAYGGRGEVRAAYQRVAVQQRRDPLLVTSKGADRALAQAFPVPRNGGTIKFKIGITAPLEITKPSRAQLALPAIVDRNFSFATELRHGIWIESKQASAASAAGLSAARVENQLFRISGALDDSELARTRPTITVDRNPAAVSRVARLGDGEAVLQEAGRAEAQQSSALMFVVDGSAALAGQTDGLIAALDAIAPGVKVGAILAAEPMQRLRLAPWSNAQKRALAEFVRAAAFVGGQDNAPALAAGLQELEAEANATLLWIHGPQPVGFQGGARLAQAATRLLRLPNLVLYGVAPGPNEVLPDIPGHGRHARCPRSGISAPTFPAFSAACPTQPKRSRFAAR
jgi:hypothetical protein